MVLFTYQLSSKKVIIKSLCLFPGVNSPIRQRADYGNIRTSGKEGL